MDIYKHNKNIHKHTNCKILTSIYSALAYKKLLITLEFRIKIKYCIVQYAMCNMMIIKQLSNCLSSFTLKKQTY